MSRTAVRVGLIVAALATIGCDRVTKHAAMTWLARHAGNKWRGLPMLGLTLFIAGGASNWFDRVFRGSVVDFLNVGVGPVRTGVFNVADVAIMTGGSIFVIAESRRARER